MSALYGSATFELDLGRSKKRPDWKHESNTSVRHIPYSGDDDVQFGGKGPPVIECDIYVSTDANASLLLGYQADGVGRSLTGFLASSGGSSYSNIFLMRIEIERDDFQEVWEGKAVFRQGT